MYHLTIEILSEKYIARQSEGTVPASWSASTYLNMSSVTGRGLLTQWRHGKQAMDEGATGITEPTVL
jgi:hypothetical protein